MAQKVMKFSRRIEKIVNLERAIRPGFSDEVVLEPAVYSEKYVVLKAVSFLVIGSYPDVLVQEVKHKQETICEGLVRPEFVEKFFSSKEPHFVSGALCIRFQNRSEYTCKIFTALHIAYQQEEILE